MWQWEKYDHMYCLLEHGANMERFLQRVKPIAYRPQDVAYNRIMEYQICEEECRNSVVAYMKCLGQQGVFPRDIRVLMGKFLWRTRRWYDWSPEGTYQAAKCSKK
jgi:hypothetical protein